MTKPIRILVFGLAGSGKTSLCNTLSRQAVEFSSSYHIYEPFEEDMRLGYELKVQLIDAVGLDKASNEGSPEGDFKQFIELLTDSEGYSLLIHVFRIPRIAQVEQYFELVANSPIPIVLVATGCEAIEPMSQWKTDNFHIFKKFGYKDLVCTCFAKSERSDLESLYAPLRAESRWAVLEAISIYAKEPILFPPEKGSIVAKKQDISPESPTLLQLLSTIFQMVQQWLIQQLHQLFTNKKEKK